MALGQWSNLGYKVIDADFSLSLGRLVTISAGPNQLHVVDPSTGLETVVALPAEPFSLSISSDGQLAAVGHDGLVSYVKLSPLAIVKSLAITGMARRVVLAPNDYIYALPDRYVRISDGAQGQVPNPYFSSPFNRSTARVHPKGDSIYVAHYNSPALKLNITGGTPTHTVLSTPGSVLPVMLCDDFWFIDRGNRIVSACGSVLQPNTSTPSAGDAPTVAKLMDDGTRFTAVADFPGAPIAALQNPGNHEQQLILHDRSTLQKLGEVGVGALPGNSSHAQTRFLYYINNGSKLLILADDEGTSNSRTQMRTFDVYGSSNCSVSATTASTTIPPTGGKIQISVNAPPVCIWRVQRPTGGWLVNLGSDMGVGPQTLTLWAPASALTQARSYPVQVGGSNLTFTQSPGTEPNLGSVFPISYVALQYDRTHDRIIVATKNPNNLYIWSTKQGGVTGIVELSESPVSLAITVDGAAAAVSHENTISQIDLGTLAIVNTHVPSFAADVLSIASGFIHAAQSTQLSKITSFNLATGVKSVAFGVPNVAGKTNPAGKYIYAGGANDALYRYATQTPLVAVAPVSSNVKLCERIWFTESGDGLITGCNTAYRLLEAGGAAQYLGAFPGPDFLRAAAHTTTLGSYILANNGLEVQFMANQSLQPVGSMAFPSLIPQSWVWDLAVDPQGSSLYGITLDPYTTAFAIQTLRLAATSGCSVNVGSVPASVAGSGGTIAIAVTGAAGCPWKTTTSTPWITPANVFAVGSGSANVSVAPNHTTVARSGKIQIGSTELIIHQQPGSPSSNSPDAQSIDPASGSPSTQVFVARFTDPNGALDIATAYLSFGKAPASPGSCTLEYRRASGSFRLLNSGGSEWISTGLSPSLSNSHCSIQSSSLNAIASGSTLAITIPATFDSSFNGSRDVYLLAIDNAGNSSGWRRRGSYNLGPGASEGAVHGVFPSSGAGASNTFTAVFSNGQSKHYLGYLLFLNTPNIVWYTAKESCLIEYNSLSNGMRLINNAGDDWLGPVSGVQLGTAGAVLQNDQCSVNISVAKAMRQGQSMIVTAPVAFKSGTPVLATFLQAFDVEGKYTGMTQVGNWNPSQTVVKAGPAITASAQSVNSGGSAIFTVGVSNSTGAANLSTIHIRAGATIVSPQECHIIYFVGENSLNLVADDELSLVGANVPLGSAGSLSNSRCSLTATGASKSLNGNTISLSVPIAFNRETFDGDRQIYVNAFDNFGNLTHWVSGGLFRVQ